MHNPYFDHDVYINVKGIKEWLNQPHCLYAEKNEALLSLPTLFASAIYLGVTPDPKLREYVSGCHIFKTTIAEEPSWIIVHENVWGEFLVHSISDNLPILDKKQDF